MKTQCEHCEHLHVDTIATAPEGAALRLAGQTVEVEEKKPKRRRAE